jgi:UDP-N-acetylglucosamine acyltransferase
VHPTSIIEPGAQIGEGSVVGPFCIVGAAVVLGKRNILRSHVVIEGFTRFGDDNQIFQFASIGATPQHLKYRGERTELIVGDSNIIREYVTMQPGTVQGQSKTIVGNKNLFMVGAHVAHDAIVGDSNVFANYACLAGHVEVGSRVTLGGLVGIHQFVRIGDMAILGAGSMVTKDIPPFVMAQGDRCHLVGINKIGLERGGLTPEQVRVIRKVYRSLFLSDGDFEARLARAAAEQGTDPFAAQLLEFVRSPSSRGLTTPRSRSNDTSRRSHARSSAATDSTEDE